MEGPKLTPQSSDQPLAKGERKKVTKLNNRSRYIVTGLLIGGFGVSVVHALQESFYISPNYCNLNSKFSCGGLFDSGYTSVLGVPFWALGLVWFVVMIPSYFFFLWKRPAAFLGILQIGNLFTLYLWNIELNIVGIICPVCVLIYCFNYAASIFLAVSLWPRVTAWVSSFD